MDEDDGFYNSGLTMNNSVFIIFAIEGNPLLVYVLRVSDYAFSPPNEHL